MNTIVKTLTLISLSLIMAACQEKESAYKSKLNIKTEPYDLKFDRYEEVLFNLDTANFQQELMKLQDRYRVFLGGDLGLESQLVNHARSGRYAKLVGVGTVQGDFASFVRDESHANPSAQDKDNPEARGLAVVNHLVLAEALCDATVRNHRLFFGRKILPKGQIRKEVTEWT